PLDKLLPCATLFRSGLAAFRLGRAIRGASCPGDEAEDLLARRGVEMGGACTLLRTRRERQLRYRRLRGLRVLLHLPREDHMIGRSEEHTSELQSRFE